MSLSNCRFYEEKYPEVDSFVMVNVKQVGSASALRAWINVRDDVANPEIKFKRLPKWVPTSNFSNMTTLMA
jgi:hypothetical protein